MQCGTILGLDQDGTGGTSFWDLGRLRPDLVLMDLVVLLHPELKDNEMSDYETIFFRKILPLSDASGVPACPKTWLPPTPEEGSVHVTATYGVSLPENNPTFVGKPSFVVLETLYPLAHNSLAMELGVDVENIELAMGNKDKVDLSDSDLVVTVTVRILGCMDPKCGINIGEKLDGIGPSLQSAIGVSSVSIGKPSTIIVQDARGDLMHLDALVESSKTNLPQQDLFDPPAPSSSSNSFVTSSSENDPVTCGSNGISPGAVVGILVGVLLFV